jgi:galactokinase
MNPPTGGSAPDGLDPAALRARLEQVELRARRNPELVRIVRAPGRVNLIGEHTDYNEGLVLPAAIDLEVRIAYVPTDDGIVELTAASGGEGDGFQLADIPGRRGRWIDYVAGVAVAMRREGIPISGFRGVLASNLPVAAGLSSSAALELASAWALAGARPPRVDPLTLARVAQWAENEYVGVACGLMDQFASACGQADRALKLDCRTLEWGPVRLPPGVEIVVCHTGSSRKLDASEYNARRADCERAVAALSAVAPEVRSLRDVDDRLLSIHRSLLDPVALRRARHVVAESARVVATEHALAGDDLRTLRELFAASHASLRDLFEVSSPELDALVDIAMATHGVIAARMTGAGFGGCTVNLVHAGEAGHLINAIEANYPRRTGRLPRTWRVRPADGASLLTPVA